MDGLPFDIATNPMPPKDWNERVEQTKAQASNLAQFAGTNLKYFGGVVKDTAVVGGSALASKTGTLKQKVQTKEWGTKVMGMFGKKAGAAKPDAEADAAAATGEEPKEETKEEAKE